jgi:acid stress-induced BolA-like protein IbaG/YrbA
MPTAYRFTFAAAAAILLSSPAIATHQGVQHYDAEKPTSVKHAFELLDVHAGLAEKDIRENHLEGVHQQSYTLEAAGDFLQDQLKRQQQELDALNESIQEIHALSEKGDTAGVKKALPRLKKHAQSLKALMEKH